jgi:hypothetical protein
LNITRHGLLPGFALVGMGLPALMGYARNRQVHHLPASAFAPALVVMPKAKGGRPMPVSHSNLWQTVRPDLFGSTLPASVPAPPIAPPSETTPAVPPLPTPVSDPLAGYAYTGTVTVNGELSALIEDRKSKQGWYVNAGDIWQSYHIVEVNERQVTVEVNGERRTLTKTDVGDVVPLVADADKDSPATEATVSISVDTAVAIYFSKVIDQTSSGLSQAEVAHIKDDAFEGRISADEAQRRLSQGSVSNLWNISVRFSDNILY